MLSAKLTPPGKTGRIEVEIKTANLSGVVEKHIRVATSDPLKPEVTLTVKVIVQPEITVSESGIYFGNAPKGKEVRKEVILTLPAGKQIKILGAETTDSRVSVTLEPLPGSNPPKWKLIAVQKADAKPGYHFGEIVVKTSSSLTPRLSIYERGTVASPGK